MFWVRRNWSDKGGEYNAVEVLDPAGRPAVWAEDCHDIARVPAATRPRKWHRDLGLSDLHDNDSYDPAMTGGDPDSGGSARWVDIRPQRPSRGRGRIAFWSLVVLAGSLCVAGAIVLFSGLRWFVTPSSSMADTIRPGQHMLAMTGDDLRRGDIIVFRRPPFPGLFTKRLIGLPGDHVACCDANGQVTVNGRALDETYLFPGDAPSAIRFSAALAPGQLWVLGDHRSESLDSRPVPGLGRFGPGPIALANVVGRVIAVGNGVSYTQVRTPPTFIADGLAPPDDRRDLGGLLPFAAGPTALLALAVFGVIRFARRHRR